MKNRAESKTKLQAIPGPEELAAEWVKLRAQLEELEQKKKKLQPLLEAYLAAQPEEKAQIGDWAFTLVRVEREFFNLAKAKEKIDGRVLNPYISSSKFTQIRQSYKGDAA